MKRNIIILMAILLIPMVIAVIIIPTDVFVNLSRADIIENINLSFKRFDVTTDNLYAHYTMNSIANVENEYHLIEIDITTELSFKIINYCLNKYDGGTCVTYLLNGEVPYNVTINNEIVTIRPINYQLITQVNHEIDILIEMQTLVHNQELINQLANAKGYQLPTI